MYKIHLHDLNGAPSGSYLSNQCPTTKDVIYFRGRQYVVMNVVWWVDDPEGDNLDNTCTTATVNVVRGD